MERDIERGREERSGGRKNKSHRQTRQNGSELISCGTDLLVRRKREANCTDPGDTGQVRNAFPYISYHSYRSSYTSAGGRKGEAEIRSGFSEN